MKVPIDSSPPRKRHSWSTVVGNVLICFFVVLLALTGVIPIVAIEVPFHLLFGWVVFFERNFNDITFDIGRITTGIVGVSLAMSGLHLLAAGWRRASRPEGSRWKWRWSAAITVAVISMGIAALSVAGVTHQIAWLKSEPKIDSGHGTGYLKMKQRNNLRNLAFLLVEFSEKHDGSYPASILDLISWYLAEGSWEGDVSPLLLFSMGQYSTPEPWLYFGRGLTKKAPDETILFAAPRPYDRLRLVVTADGKVSEIPEDEFQNVVSTQERQRKQ